MQVPCAYKSNVSAIETSLRKRKKKKKKKKKSSLLLFLSIHSLSFPSSTTKTLFANKKSDENTPAELFFVQEAFF
jgi:hypothetical protein